MSAQASLASARAQLQARWGALAARERRGLGAALALVGVALVWGLAVQPAWRTLRAAPAQHDRLDAELLQMRRLAAEAAELRASPGVPAAQAVAALQSATERLGGKGRLALQGERALLTLDGASGEALRAWLAEARRAARARPLEAQLTRGPQGWSGTLVVGLGAAP